MTIYFQYSSIPLLVKSMRCVIAGMSSGSTKSSLTNTLAVILPKPPWYILKEHISKGKPARFSLMHKHAAGIFRP